MERLTPIVVFNDVGFVIVDVGLLVHCLTVVPFIVIGFVRLFDGGTG